MGAVQPLVEGFVGGEALEALEVVFREDGASDGESSDHDQRAHERDFPLLRARRPWFNRVQHRRGDRI